jgi:hypothetical protein
MSVNAASAARADTRCDSVLASGQQHAPARFHQSDCWIGARVPAFGATKCFKRFVKLGLKNEEQIARACSKLKHDGYRLQIHARDGALFTARQRP